MGAVRLFLAKKIYLKYFFVKTIEERNPSLILLLTQIAHKLREWNHAGMVYKTVNNSCYKKTASQKKMIALLAVYLLIAIVSGGYDLLQKTSIRIVF